MKVWVDTHLRDENEAHVSVFDHGFTVGDGVFETAKVVHGIPFAITRHLERLVRSAHGLGLHVDPMQVRVAVTEVLAENETLPLARLRITVTGGHAPLGSDRGDAHPTLIVAIAPGKEWPPTADVAVVPWVRNERAATAGLKTTSYADNVVALEHAHNDGATEAMFGNTIGNLCEGTGTNVFLAVDGHLVTPPLSSGCLPGVTRALLLEWLGDVDEVDVPLTALRNAAEAFLTSSTRDIQPIRAVDGQILATAPGPLTQRAMDVWKQREADNPDP
ncbi:MAG: branched-chain amino acid aminotransferase [Frankiales bacterium]|nr:branched-chain amino acid aminotransferase [Frankiales bacterium]